ncbi:MAG: hypothetical protein RQ885_12805 [Desulfurococcales archaeon]|jgi:hypothetical protein|nr:hypothetical protein [Desulfurococcales archaeon]
MNILGALSSGSKRFVPVSEGIIREAMRISERSGIPLRDLIEKILETVINYMRYKPNLLEVIHLLDSLEDLRRIGCVMLPQGAVKKILSKASEEDFREILEELGKTASWYGVVAKAKRGSSIDDIQTVLQVWMPNIEVHVSSVDGGQGRYKIVISPPIHMIQDAAVSERMALVLETIARNIVNSMGGSIEKATNSDGIVSMVIAFG